MAMIMMMMIVRLDRSINQLLEIWTVGRMNGWIDELRMTRQRLSDYTRLHDFIVDNDDDALWCVKNIIADYF